VNSRRPVAKKGAQRHPHPPQGTKSTPSLKEKIQGPPAIIAHARLHLSMGNDLLIDSVSLPADPPPLSQLHYRFL